MGHLLAAGGCAGVQVQGLVLGVRVEGLGLSASSEADSGTGSVSQVVLYANVVFACGMALVIHNGTALLPGVM
jgi:hypothetical protein